MPQFQNQKVRFLGFTLAVFIVMSACIAVTAVSTPETSNLEAPRSPSNTETAGLPQTLLTLLPPPRIPGSPILTPTPDAPHHLPSIRSEKDLYVVQPNDTLNKIARSYGISLNALIQANEIANPDYLEVGQELQIPSPQLSDAGPADKIIPDSELVRGPTSAVFDTAAFIQAQNGYLANYQEEIDGRTYSAAEIIDLVALQNSVHPRILLAVLEYQSGWVTQKNPPDASAEQPILVDASRAGLYRQLYWTANNLNRGYYLWKINAVSTWVLADESIVPVNSTLNAGSAAVQYTMSLLLGQQDWLKAVGENGVQQTFTKLFGYPFDFAVEPLIPQNLTQPQMQLPFELGKTWSFTGGPHAAWGDGSAWAAIDFAPPGDALGCVQSDEWVTAAAAGVITYSQNGMVILDLDGDGFDQTGWALLYLHIETRGKVPVGTELQPGGRIGHPSCEGGISNGTHVHLARRYNGEWISADGPLPFNLDGWVSSGYGVEYDGEMQKSNSTIEAWDRRDEKNQIHR